jgi:hypothetical protein
MDEVQRLQHLQDELLATLERVLHNGTFLSDEILGLIAEQLEWIVSRIEELSQAGAPPGPPEKIRMARPFPSSNIHSFGYDDKTDRLFVKFQGDFPDQNGPVYGYEGVPKQIFELFRAGAVPARTDGQNQWGRWWKGKQPSLGSSLYTLIAGGNYPYHRLT